ncbi:MAG: type 1 glutamine amidotransferase [Candidatus Hydrogenedentota bacterium]|nr:MAG: type 1 glutamine amidotransferase [Candidatus Hydrogenedentota bacterium]
MAAAINHGRHGKRGKEREPRKTRNDTEKEKGKSQKAKGKREKEKGNVGRRLSGLRKTVEKRGRIDPIRACRGDRPFALPQLPIRARRSEATPTRNPRGVPIGPQRGIPRGGDPLALTRLGMTRSGPSPRGKAKAPGPQNTCRGKGLLAEKKAREDSVEKKVLFIKNIEREGPGVFLDFVQRRRIPYRVVEAADSASVGDPDHYRAIVLLGGPKSANDPDPVIRWEEDFVRRAVEIGVPLLGVCLGMQILGKAFGGRVVSSPVKEIGFQRADGAPFVVNLRPDAVPPLLKDLPLSFTVFHLHGEMVEPAGKVRLIGTGNPCPVQVIAVGQRAVGFQGHVEITEALLRRWLREDPDLKNLPEERILEEHRRSKEERRSIAEILIGNLCRAGRT